MRGTRVGGGSPGPLGAAVRQPGARAITHHRNARSAVGTRVVGAIFDAVAAGIATGDIMLTNDLVPQPMSSDFERIRQEFGFPGDDHVIAKCFLLWAGMVGCDQPGGVRSVRRRHADRPRGGVRQPDAAAGRRADSALTGRRIRTCSAGLCGPRATLIAAKFSVPFLTARAAGLFCETMNLPLQSPIQIAWVTPDLDATETALTGLLGVRKWVRIPDVHFAPDTCSYHGKPADFVAGISLSYLGDMQLELIAAGPRGEYL